MTELTETFEREFMLVQQPHQSTSTHSQKVGSLLRCQPGVDPFDTDRCSIFHYEHSLPQHFMDRSWQRGMLTTGFNQDSWRRVVLQETPELAHLSYILRGRDYLRIVGAAVLQFAHTILLVQNLQFKHIVHATSELFCTIEPPSGYHYSGQDRPPAQPREREMPLLYRDTSPYSSGIRYRAPCARVLVGVGCALFLGRLVSDQGFGGQHQ